MDPITPLNRVALQLGPISIYWYGVILGTGALVGLLMAMREAKRLGIEPDIFVDLVMWGAPISIVCARIYYVIFEWDNYYKYYPEQIIAIWEGGIAIHGALIGAVLTGIVFCRKRGLSFWRIADIAAPSILTGQAIGRWGNFVNQEAHGGEVSRAFLESLHLPTFIIDQMYIKGAYYHPTFLYESLWNFLGVALLLVLRRKAPLRRGELFCTYLIWYSFGRFFIEGLRTDSLMVSDTLRAAQMISVLIIVVAVALIIVRRRKGYANLKYGE